jgi:hypothetical protein
MFAILSVVIVTLLIPLSNPSSQGQKSYTPTYKSIHSGKTVEIPLGETDYLLGGGFIIKK